MRNGHSIRRRRVANAGHAQGGLLHRRLHRLRIRSDRTFKTVSPKYRELTILIGQRHSYAADVVKKENQNQSDSFFDCAEARSKLGSNYAAGTHNIRLSVVNSSTVKANCDRDGWLVFQSRGDFNNSEEMFYRGWDEYVQGFGTPGCIREVQP